jgi:hypothetical protein
LHNLTRQCNPLQLLHTSSLGLLEVLVGCLQAQEFQILDVVIDTLHNVMACGKQFYQNMG